MRVPVAAWADEIAGDPPEPAMTAAARAVIAARAASKYRFTVITPLTWLIAGWRGLD